MARIPDRIERIAKLVAQPSVSCMDPAFDQSNRGVVEQLAEWLTPLGFDVQLLPLEGDRKARPFVETPASLWAGCRYLDSPGHCPVTTVYEGGVTAQVTAGAARSSIRGSPCLDVIPKSTRSSSWASRAPPSR